MPLLTVARIKSYCDCVDVGQTPVVTIKKVLVVDDFELLLKSSVREFKRQGMTALTARTAAEALSLAAEHKPDLAIIDLFLKPPDDGIQVLKALKEAPTPIYCMVVSAHMSVTHAVMAVRAGADDVFHKPFTARQALQRVAGRPPSAESEIPTLDQIEWEHIARVLSDCDGNITHAAEALGVYRQSLQRKIQKHAPRVLHPGEQMQTTRSPRRGPRQS